jgi:virginiamycin A acetyltransferase
MKPLPYLMYRAYGSNRRLIKMACISIINRIEGGEFYSKTLRTIFEHFHQVKVGLYSHGACFVENSYDKYTEIGRYSSLASGSCSINTNHPTHFKSTHGFFFNPKLQKCESLAIDYHPLKIGNDVWIGRNAILLPNVNRVGDGAVIAAGAVVNKDVPEYAIVVGNPARIIRFRFSEKTRISLLESKWWEKPIEDLNYKEFQNFSEC